MWIFICFGSPLYTQTVLTVVFSYIRCIICNINWLHIVLSFSQAIHDSKSRSKIQDTMTRDSYAPNITLKWSNYPWRFDPSPSNHLVLRLPWRFWGFIAFWTHVNLYKLRPLVNGLKQNWLYGNGIWCVANVWMDWYIRPETTIQKARSASYHLRQVPYTYICVPD